MGMEGEYVNVSKEEWEGFIRDNEQLMQRYKELLGKVKELESQNKVLTEKLSSIEKAREELGRGDETMKQLRAQISQLLQQ